MLKRKTVVLAKVETVYGTDPTPTAAANAIEAYEAALKPNGEALERKVLHSSLSQVAFARGLKYYDLTFKTELKGTGTRGVLPTFGWLGPLFRACAMSETVTAATSIAYQPVSANFESCALYLWMDGIFHKLLGCKGSFKITMEVGKYPEIEWKFSGLYASPADGTPTAVTLSSVIAPVITNASFTFGGYAGIISKLEIDQNNTISQRQSVNAPTGLIGFEITDRVPQGSFDPEVVIEATYAFWNKWELATAQALNMGPVGATSGNIIQIAAPKVQQKDQTYADRNGQLTYAIPIELKGNAGDDELVVTIT